MRHLTATEIGALILSAFFFIGGLALVIDPKEMVISHRGQDAASDVPQTFFEVVSKKNCPFYGLAAMVFGGGLAVFVLWPTKKTKL